MGEWDNGALESIAFMEKVGAAPCRSVHAMSVLPARGAAVFSLYNLLVARPQENAR
jgi:hypothetical protein